LREKRGKGERGKGKRRLHFIKHTKKQEQQQAWNDDEKERKKIYIHNK